MMFLFLFLFGMRPQYLLMFQHKLISYFKFVIVLPPRFFPMFQVTATHSNCIIKKEQETCLEKIRRAAALNPLNDSSPGEFQLGINHIC